jgi:chromosome segregation ATPase
MDSGDREAVTSDAAALRGKLEQSEHHLVEVSRKMTKAHKRQENLLAQFEAEIELLSDKVEQLEDECCEAEGARLKAESASAESEGRARSLMAELERYERRAAIQPAGVQELADQLEMANSVKEMMVNDMALRTDELAQLKVEHALVQAEKEETHLRMRKSEERVRVISLHMTKLEVQMAEWEQNHAELEEDKAKAFQEAMQSQETIIHQLEGKLADAIAQTPTKSSAKRWFA